MKTAQKGYDVDIRMLRKKQKEQKIIETVVREMETCAKNFITGDIDRIEVDVTNGQPVNIRYSKKFSVISIIKEKERKLTEKETAELQQNIMVCYRLALENIKTKTKNQSGAIVVSGSIEKPEIYTVVSLLSDRKIRPVIN